jgi:hypothetical protein
VGVNLLRINRAEFYMSSEPIRFFSNTTLYFADSLGFSRCRDAYRADSKLEKRGIVEGRSANQTVRKLGEVQNGTPGFSIAGC